MQFLWVQQAPSKVRKLMGCGSNAEGWAHYTEQMMLDEGYARDPKLPEGKDVNFLKIRLGQFQDALLRDARFIAGIDMHTGKMSFEQAVEFFVKEGYQPHAVALTRDQARHLRSHLPGLHAGQVGDHETARGLPEEDGRQL